LILESRSQVNGPFDPYNYRLNYFPIESFFWPPVACIIENQKIDLEMTSRDQVDL